MQKEYVLRGRHLPHLGFDSFQLVERERGRENVTVQTKYREMDGSYPLFYQRFFPGTDEREVLLGVAKTREEAEQRTYNWINRIALSRFNRTMRSTISDVSFSDETRFNKGLSLAA